MNDNKVQTSMNMDGPEATEGRCWVEPSVKVTGLDEALSGGFNVASPDGTGYNS